MKAKRRKKQRLRFTGTSDGISKAYWFIWLYRMFFEPERWLRRSDDEKRCNRHIYK